MTHNLDITSYTLDEIFQLFDLDYQLTAEKLKHAKQKVLMTHPDKSKLDPKYFIFYKKAYDIILNMYKEQTKYNQSSNGGGNISIGTQQQERQEKQDEYISKQIKNAMGTMGQEKFHDQFNRIYEEKAMKKIDESRYKWFQESNEYYVDGQVNAKNMGDMMNQVRKKQSNELIHYNGVREIRTGYMGGSNYYDDDDDELATKYVECDPFSKLKFDDVRKVHKDQTVFSISEADYQGQKYKNIQEYQMARERNMGNTISKAESERMLQEKHKQEQIELMKRQYRNQMIRAQNEQMQEQVRGTFLRLGNGG